MIGKRGNVFLSVAIAIAIWIFGVLFIPFITDDIESSRVAMDCVSTSISHGAMLNCLTIDLVTPYFIWFLISLFIGFIMGATR